MFIIPEQLLAVTSPDSINYDRQDSEHIKEIMTAWDDQEGPWLYESMATIVMKDAHPIRPSAVSSTTFELIQKMDDGRVERVERVAETQLENERNTSGDDRETYYWEEWLRLLRSADCEMSSSSSNGDPHLKSYDGEKYDFQTAGDYLLTSSNDERFMIQTQQVRHNDNISVNGAAYLNVNGDAIEIFAQNKPEALGNKSILINGQTVENENADIILENGGVIRYQKGRHVVSWPTGEQLQVSQRTFQESKLLDLFVFVPGCNDFYDGLLGNNNGERDDDVVARDNQTGEETRRADLKLSFDAIFGADRRNANNRDRQVADLNFISRDFGSQFALDSSNSRFSNPMTNIADDVRFPKENITLADMEDDKLEEAIKVARDAGVEDEDLFAAVYDYGFVGLEPITERPDYIKPEVRQENDEPKTKEDNNQRRDDDGRLIEQIRIGTGVFNGGTIRTNPRTQPRPTNRGGVTNGGGRNNR
jgi:hypothetical protein